MLNPCPICRYLRFSHEALCDHCRDKLLKLKSPYVRDEGRLQICSLFAWTSPGPLAFAWWIKALKHQEREILWREIAIWLLHSFGPLEPTIFIPIPSRNPNHARGLARTLAQATGFPHADALGLTQDREQKTKSRGERQDIQFEREIWDRFDNVVIVDDVVTTGATAHAAFHTLGRPAKTRVWCVLDRRPCAF